MILGFDVWGLEFGDWGLGFRAAQALGSGCYVTSPARGRDLLLNSPSQGAGW